MGREHKIGPLDDAIRYDLRPACPTLHKNDNKNSEQKSRKKNVLVLMDLCEDTARGTLCSRLVYRNDFFFRKRG